MTKHKKLYNNKPYGNGPNSVKKAITEAKKIAAKQYTGDTKGLWEFTFHQKKEKSTVANVIPNENNEQKIKANLRTENSFNPKLIHEYINVKKTLEETILEKKNNNEKINKKEQIILDNYLKKKKDAYMKDMSNIQTLGLRASPETNEGKTKLMLLGLAQYVEKNNIDLICNFSLLINDSKYNIEPFRKEYEKVLQKMESVVENNDLIKMQFTKFYNMMPPLNVKGFHSFDPWQIEVINNIDKNISTIVCAPTSAGKTVLSGYTGTKGKTLILCPTDPLAWQMASYYGGILDSDVPIITNTYMSIPERDLMVELINESKTFVATPEVFVDLLPLISVQYDWIVFDEIHMIGKPEGSAMEIIAKMFPKSSFLALSATIGNVDTITKWFKSLNPNRDIANINCDKRFFNLQRYYYNPIINKENDFGRLEFIHPLSMVSCDDFKDKSILQKNLQPTPQDTWALYEQLSLYYDLKELHHTQYFEKREHIHLSKATKYFFDLINYMASYYDEDKISKIIANFKRNELCEENVDLVNLCMLLKKENKAPAIIFQKNTMACLRMVRNFAKRITQLEDDKYPKLIADRVKLICKAKRLEKKADDKPSTVDNSRKELKKFLETETKEQINITALQEPTQEFTLNNSMFFTENIIDDWSKMLKKFFPQTGDEYHYIIKLLWRGVGVYAIGLPEAYLRLVQNLASKKQLAIVFSDTSLVFGVSMPFRTAVIYRDTYVEDNLDAMMYYQMTGRAGRRGLDKEGNVIFVGFKWSRIEELSVCKIPNVSGVNTLNFVVPQANKISQVKENNLNWDNMFVNSLKNINNSNAEDDDIELYEGLKSNYMNGWKFALSDDINHNHMMWVLRNTEEPIIIAYILPYLKKAFDGLDPTVENNQISIAHFLSHFVHIHPIEKDDLNMEEYILPKCPILEQPSFQKIYSDLEDLQLDIPKHIDGRVFMSIKINKLISTKTEQEADIIRTRLIDFGNKVKAIQHYCFHNKIINVSKLLGKLLTRLWWNYHTSSPIMKSFNAFDEDIYDIVDISNSDSD